MFDLSYYVNAMWSSACVLLLMFVSFLVVVSYLVALDVAPRGQHEREAVEAELPPV